MSGRMAIVMAGGKGTRMNSDLPKVLVPVCGRPMIHYVIDALGRADVDCQVVVVGYRGDLVRSELAGRDRVAFAEQPQQLGTGHAVMMCRRYLQDHDGPVMVVAGDSPLIQVASVTALFDSFARSRPACILGTGYRDDPAGFGRILRDPKGRFAGIVEQRDADPQQQQIREVNLSCYIFQAGELLWSLDQLDNRNAQSEYYVTDCPGILLAAGKEVIALDVLQPCESLSVNTPDDLQAVEAVMRQSGGDE